MAVAISNDNSRTTRTTPGRTAKEQLDQFADYSNPRGLDLNGFCPQLNAAPLFGTQDMTRIGFPDVHPSVSAWGSDTYITGWVVVGEQTAIYPGCNFMGDAQMPMMIGKRCSLQHVELHYSGFRMLPTNIGDDTFLSHLAFIHSAVLGQRCYVLGHATFYDGAVVGDDVFIEGNSTILGNARLRSGWAYDGRVDKDTEPTCRTSEVVFGTDPKTGETLYIGGERGVGVTVNNSHLRRNENQMRLVAFKLGRPEDGAPAYAVTISHVYATASHYLSLAALILDRLSLEPQSNTGLRTDDRRLANECRALCMSIRVVYNGVTPNTITRAAWRSRSRIIEAVAARVEEVKEPLFIQVPSLTTQRVVQELEDLHTLSRKLREFETVMIREEALSQSKQGA